MINMQIDGWCRGGPIDHRNDIKREGPTWLLTQATQRLLPFSDKKGTIWSECHLSYFQKSTVTTYEILLDKQVHKIVTNDNHFERKIETLFDWLTSLSW